MVVVVDSKNLNITRGQDLMKLYGEEGFADRYFCSRCGSSLYVVGVDKSYVSAGILRDLKLKPAFHIQVAHKAPWDEISGSAPQFPEWPPS
jgi:hypothetical protein